MKLGRRNRLSQQDEDLKVAAEMNADWYWYPNHGGGAIRHYESHGMGMVKWHDDGPYTGYAAEFRKGFNVFNDYVGSYEKPGEAIRAVDKYNKEWVKEKDAKGKS